jgi:hypothetical protein
VLDGGVQPQLSAMTAVRFQELEQLYLAWNLSVQLSTPPPRNPQTSGSGGGKDNEFYANVGNAIRTLREEIPLLFQQDFTCEPFIPCKTWHQYCSRINIVIFDKYMVQLGWVMLGFIDA